MIPWLECKIFGHKWRVMTIQENVYYDGENDEYQEWDTCIYYNCLLCKKSKVEMIPAKLLDKEKIDLVESYEDSF